jgi:tripartite-type tricarboxylate transporter receptor subunit TctC
LQARFGKDLAAVATLADTANILVVHPSLGVKKLADLIALAKKQDLLYATAGVGSATHLTSELFNSMAGVKTNAGALSGWRRRFEGSSLGPGQDDVFKHCACDRLRAGG